MPDSTYIDADKVYLKELFSNRYFFVVPEIQRPFVWNRENFEQLFNDIYDAILNNLEENPTTDSLDSWTPYFLGTLVLLAKRVSDDGSGEYAIIDGQQRLVTLMILVSVLRDLIVDDQTFRENLHNYVRSPEIPVERIQAKPRVRIRDSEADFFERYIWKKEGATKQLIKEPKQWNN